MNAHDRSPTRLAGWIERFPTPAASPRYAAKTGAVAQLGKRRKLLMKSRLVATSAPYVATPVLTKAAKDVPTRVVFCGLRSGELGRS